MTRSHFSLRTNCQRSASASARSSASTTACLLSVMRAIRLAGGSPPSSPYGEASSATPASGTRKERRGAGVDRDQEGTSREQAARLTGEED